MSESSEARYSHALQKAGEAFLGSNAALSLSMRGLSGLGCPRRSHRQWISLQRAETKGLGVTSVGKQAV